MARDNTIKILRTTRANLNSQASANGLVVGEPYLITDEGRIAVALTVSTYADYKKVSDTVTSVIPIIIDGGGVAIAAGQIVEIPDLPSCTVTGWTIGADASGSAVVTISKCTYANFPTFTAISGTEKPTLSSAQKNQDLSLSTWTTSITQGEILRASVDSASTVQRLSIGLRVTL